MKLASPEHTMENYPPTVGIGIKAVSQVGTIRLVKAAIQYAIDQKKQERHDRPQGQHHEIHRGRVPRLGLQRGGTHFRRQGLHLGASGNGRKRRKGEAAANDEQKPRSPRAGLLIKDAIADITLQQVLTRPTDFDVIATLNLERRLLERRARRAGRRHRHRARRQHQLRHRPRHLRGHARHRAQIREQGQGEPRLRRAERRNDAALPRLDGSGGPDHQRDSTARSAASASPTISRGQMEGATEIKCSEFGDNIIAHM